MKPPKIHPRKEMIQLLLGYQVQQAIYVAAKLGIADLLRNGPMRIEALAQAANAHAGALYRLLRVLASYGIFIEDDQGRFDLTPLAELLQAGTPHSMSAFALWSGGVSYQAFGELEYSVRTGKPAFEYVFGTEFFDYLAHNPDVGDVFDELMSQHTAPIARVIAALDFSDFSLVVDVGGSRGDVLAAILKTHPSLRGVLIDHARVIKNAKRVLEEAEVLDRCLLVNGNILDSVPCNGDVYLLKSVVHGMDDGTAVHLLKNCRHAMNDGGSVLLVEFVMPPGNDPFPGKLMDLLMLIGGPGRERTEEEFRSLLTAAGFEMIDVTQTKFSYSIIEGKAA